MMQQTMRFFAKICAMTALCASVQIYADTVTVDGVVWTYAVKNGEATVGSGESNGDGAVAKTTADAVIIPSTLGGCPVTKIAMYAFEDCKNLTEVVIPDSVRSAEWMAFYGCSSLTRVKFGAGFQRMEGHCFEGCKSLATIDIPSTITSIPSFCFRSCGVKVLAIPSQITRIGEYAFSRCNDLTTIAIGANLSSIGEEAFSHSPKLSSITIDAANNRFKVKDGILYDTNSEAAIVGLSGITSVEIEDGTTEIHGGAFSYASPTSISIPSSVTRIGSWAFGSNGDATLIPGLLLADGWIVGTDWSNGSGPVGHLDLTGVRGIAEIAVMSSPNLTGVLLPPVKTIPLQAFDFCASLVEVNIPDGVESIGMYAFENCTSLPEITIPSSVTNIGYRAFGGDANLLKVYLPKHFESEENIRERVFPSCPDALALVFYEEGELNFASVTFIANDGSEDKTSKRVLVGNAVGNLPVPKRSGFLFDGWWTDAEGGTRIDSSFLMPAEGLSVYAHWVECAYDWSYNASESGVVITGVSPAEGDVEIPSQIGGVPVVGIADFAFENSAGLTGIAIPSSVTNIGYGAFYLCPSLVKMTLPVCVCDNTCPLLNIFDNPYGLKEVVINAGVEAIGDYVFSGALNLRKVTIPDSVKRISQRAFDVSSACFDITNYPGLLVVDGWVVGENLEMDPAAFEGVESLDLSEYKGVVDGATFLSVFPNLREIVLPQSTKSFDAAYSYLFPLNGYTKRLVFPAALTKLNADGMMNLISYGNIEFFFKGNAPELVYDSVAYPYGYEFYSGADVRILVKRTTSGWGGVPGTWHGIPVDYVAMEEDDQPQEPSDFAEWANAVKGGVYSGRWCTGKLAGFAAGYQARIAANPNDYEARLLHAAAIVLSLGENETFKGYLKTFGFEIDYLGLKLSGEESDPGTWPAANELVDALVAQCAPVLQTALEDLRAIPDGWTGEVRLDSTTWPLDEDVYIDIADILYARAGLESVLGTLYFLKGYDLTVDWPKARSLDKPPIPVLADAPSFESDDGWDGALTLGSRCYEDSSVGPSVQMAFADRNLYIRFNSAEGFDAEDSLSDIWIDGIVGTREIQVQYSAWDGNSVVNNGAVSYPEWTEGMEWAEWNELYNSYAANNVSCPVEISKSTNNIIIKIDMSGAGMDDNFGRMSYDYASFTLRHPNRPHYQWGYLNDYYSYDCDERLNWIPSFQKEQTNFFSSVRSLDNLEYAHDWMRIALIESLAAYVAMTNRAEDGKYRFLEYDPSLSNQFDVARMTTEKAIAALYAVTTVDCKETFGKYNPEKDYTLLPNNGVMQVYLGALFSGRFNRGLVPTLELDKYATLKPVGAISDPTFGGILPQTTSSQLIETLDNYGIAHGLEASEPVVATHTVTFDLGEHGTRTGGGELVQTVTNGCAAVAPVAAVDFGWARVGWSEPLANITNDVTIAARYDAAFRLDITNAIDGVAYSGRFLNISDHTQLLWSVGRNALSADALYEVVTNDSSFAAFGGSALGLTGDDVAISYTLPFAFPFYGHEYTTVYPNSNGAIFLGAPSPRYHYVDSFFKTNAMIASFWTDLNNGDVYVTKGADFVKFRWASQYYNGGAPVNVSTTLYKDGTIRISYGSGNANGGVIGISAGDGSHFVFIGDETKSLADHGDIVLSPTGFPTWLRLSPDGTLSGMPLETGTFEFNVRVSDGEGRMVAVPVKIVVAENPNRRPVAEGREPSNSSVDAFVGHATTFTATAMDPDGGDVSYVWSIDGETVADTISSNFVFTATTSGVHTVSCSATDGFWTVPVASWNVSVGRYIYVDASAQNWENPTGNSIEDAYPELSWAIYEATPQDVILVAPGDYPWYASMYEVRTSMISLGGAECTTIRNPEMYYGYAAQLYGYWNGSEMATIEGFTIAGYALYNLRVRACVVAGLRNNYAVCDSCDLYGCYVYGNEAQSILRYSTADHCTIANNLIGPITETEYEGEQYAAIAGYSTVSDSIVINNSRQNGTAANFAIEGENYYYDSLPSFYNCCTEPVPQYGAGNFVGNPRFVDAATGDYRLRVGTDCEGIGAYLGPLIGGYVVHVDVDGSGNVDKRTSVVEDGMATVSVTESSRPFLGFEIDGNVVTTGTTLELQNVTNDISVVARFAYYTWYVDAINGANTNSGISVDSPLATIAAAVPRAEPGEEILVADGVYGYFYTDNKRVAIRSMNGPATTIIDGGGRNQCVYVGENHATNTVLEGFTLRNGYSYNGGAVYGGTLKRCILTGNRSCYSGGASCYGVQENCLYYNNVSTNSNGGAAFRPMSRNCTFVGNSAKGSGGGVAYGKLYNCIVYGNTAGYSGNGSDNIYYTYMSNSVADVVRSDYDWGGNITNNPCFVDSANHDYRLALGSPCVDSGDNSQVNALIDLDGRPRIQNGVVDMGCYERTLVYDQPLTSIEIASGTYVYRGVAWTPEVTVKAGDEQLRKDEHFTLEWFDNVDAGTAKVVATGIAPICRGAVTNTFAIVPKTLTNSMFSVGAAYPFTGEEVCPSVTIAESTLTTNDWSVAYANNVAPGMATVTLTGKRNYTGTASRTFAISCPALYVSAASGDDAAFGVSVDAPKRSLQAAVAAAYDGAVIYVGDGVYEPINTANKAIRIVSENGYEKTIIDGGGSNRCVYTAWGMATNTVIEGFTIRNGRNITGQKNVWGVGVHGGTLRHCVIRDCSTDGATDVHGGGAAQSVLENCLIFNNSAHNGGGARDCVLVNCTVVSNTAIANGGGTYGGTNCNSIVWGNTAPNSYSNYYNGTFTYSCTAPSVSGVGNISANPYFTDPVHVDYRLRHYSPCIDAGDNSYVVSEIDLVREDRIIGEKVDIGAYEYQGKDIPDVVVDSMVVSQASMMPGDTVTVRYVEANIGTTNAVAQWIDRVMLEGADGTRVNLKTLSVTNVLDVGQVVTNEVQCTIPDLVPLAGDLRFVVLSDANNDVEEVSEANNEGKSDVVSLGAKLYLTAASESVKENVSGGVRFTVKRSGPVNEALAVAIGNTDSASAAAPVTVTIPAGSVSTIFTVAPVDDAVVDGTRIVNVSVSADGFVGAFVSLTILDDEVPRLTVSLDKTSVREGDGVITATVTREGSTDGDLTVYLAGGSSSRVSYPSSVVIPAGAASETFEISVPNNDTAQISQELTLRASSSGYTSTSITYTVEDDDVPGVTLSLTPEVVSEGAGAQAIYATLTRSDTNQIAQAVRVRLTASEANQLILPSEITIPKYTMAVRFAIGVVDNALDDGDREIDIDGAIVIESCGCNGQSSNGDVIHATVGIIDNDGPALVLRADPTTMKEGYDPAGYLILSHNSTLTEDLTVRLWVDAENEDEIVIPETVTIHAGETSVRIPVTTLDDGVEDGGQIVSVYVEDESNVFAPASTWVQVSDQNLPDLTVAKIETVSSVVAVESLEVSFAVTNVGFMATSRAIPYAVHLVKGASASAVSSATLVKSGTLTGSIEVGDALNGTVTLTAPELPGDYRVAVVIDPDGTISELDSANNTGWSAVIGVTVAYTATAGVDKKVYMPGETVVITGVATRADGTVAGNVQIDPYVTMSGMRRSLLTTTGADGAYSATFTPSSGEAGDYAVGACYPGVNSKVAQDTFSIIGMKRGSTANIIWDIALGDSATRTVTIQNRSAVPLTGLTATFTDVPEECGFTYTLPETIPANGSVTLSMTATADGLTDQVDYRKFYAHLAVAEGLTLDFPLYFHSQAQRAYMRATPTSINTTMAIGHTRYIEVAVVNDGKGDSGAVTVSVPSVNWLRIVSGASIDNLASGESATVTLAVSPTAEDGLTLNSPLSGGRMAVNCANGTGCSVSLKFTPVSEATGSITVDAVDNNTYTLESAPHLSNATVRVSNPYTGATVATGKTGTDGIWTADNIPEGTYQLTITAPNHDSYENVIEINPALNARVTAFLQYQLVSASWTVVKSEIEDAYEVQLVLEYETQVPAPIVKATLPDHIDDLAEGESITFTINVQNVGLITAEQVDLVMPEIPDHQFTLSDNGFKLSAGESRDIAVRFEHLRRARNLRASGSGVGTQITTWVVGQIVRYICGGDRSYSSYYHFKYGTHPVYIYGDDDSVVPYVEPKITVIRDPSRNPSKDYGDNYGSGGFSGLASHITVSGCEIAECLSAIAGCLTDIFVKGNPIVACVTGIIDCGESIYDTVKDDERDGVTVVGSVVDCGIGISGCFGGHWIITAISCIKNIGGSCVLPFIGRLVFSHESSKITSRAFAATSTFQGEELKTKFPEFATAVAIADVELPAIRDWNVEFFGDVEWLNCDEKAKSEFLLAVKDMLQNYDSRLSVEKLLLFKPENISPELVEKFVARINAYLSGVRSDDSEDAGESEAFRPSLLAEYAKRVHDCEQLVSENGYTSIVEYLNEEGKKVLEYIESARESVCASVTLKLSQTLAMTREAFDGTLTLYNGNTTTPITNLKLDVSVLDEDGNECKDLFEIFANGTSGDMSDGSALSGGLSVSAGGTGSAMIRFIPERGAAPTEEKLYRFGGTVTYTDPFSGETATVKLTPVALTVSPSPYLHLDYFVQRDVFADDPSTPDVVEASMPAELAVLVRNVGGGNANKVTIASAQPEMVQNEKGLSAAFNLKDYTLEASALNGATAHLGLNTVSLGTIEPNESKVAQWWLTSTIEGHFVGMSATVTPVNSWNTPDTALVDPNVGVHKLVRSIVADGDTLPDFLVCDGSDLYGKPNEIYTALGDQLPVYVAAISASTALSAGSEIELPISLTPAQSGWNYGYATIPSIFHYTISRIVRGDGTEIPLRNAWITDRTFRDGTTPLIEDRLHLVDEFSSGSAQTYTVYLAAKPTDVPEVASFDDMTDGAIENAVRDSVTVTFSKPIDPLTFTFDDLTLTKQGAYLDDLSSLTITAADDSGARFTIGNIAALCGDYGRYELTVQCAGVADVDGNLGRYGKSIAWTYAANGSFAPQLVSLVRRMSDGFGGTEFVVTFDRNVDATTVVPGCFTLRRNGSQQFIPVAANISAQSAAEYVLSGVDSTLAGEGVYELTFSANGVTDEAGNEASGSRSVTWTVDTTPPAQIADLAISPDGGFSDADGITYTGALTVSGTLPEAGLSVEIIAKYVGGGETVLATFDGGDAAPQFSQNVNLPGAGNVTLVVRLTDAAGNSSDTEKGVYVDGIALVGSLTGASEDEGVVTAAATLTFSDRVMEGDVTLEKFALTRDGEAVALAGVTLAKVNDTTFSLVGLESLCAEDGVYVLTFNGAAVRKYTSGLTMGGSLVMRWTYENPDCEPPTVTAVRFDGETPHEAYTNVFSSVDVIFSEAVNVPELIENGLIQRAARIDLLDVAGTVTGCVAAVRRDGDIAPYQWNVDANTLSWQIDSAGVPAGGARLMLDAGLIRDLAGNRLAVDENGQAARSTNGLRTYTLSETLLAQVNAQAMPMWYNGELYVGEKTVDNKGKIRHYAANGTWTYLQSDGVDIEIPAQGCQGASVAFADMDGDGAAETYIGTTAGDVLKYPGGTAIASLGANRAMPYAYDIDGDGRDELITGGMDGRIRIISLDEDSSTYSVAHISDVNGAPITVLNGRAAPMVADINHDGLADIVSGDTAGNVWAYLGVDATSASLPVCAMPVCVFTNGVGLADRSRLGYGDVNKDGIADLIVGRSDGSVTVMYGAETPSPAVPFAVKAVVSASAGTHGAITPVGDVTYDGGDAPEYTITPNVGYHVVDVQIDGVSIGVTNGYVFVPLTTSHAIHADFAVTPYAITYTGLKGATNPNPTSYTVEDAITFAAPGEIYGWVFKGWTPVFIALGSTGAVEVTANWERQKFDVTVNGETKQYNYEDVATFTTDAVINCGATQYVCKGWSATNADPASGEGARAEFRVLGDVTLDWQRETNVVTIAQAANAEGFEWTTGGAAEWMPEWSDEAADNVHQARCGAIPNGTNAWLATTVEGPGMLVFKWRSALASRNTKYQLMVDGEVKGMLTGTNEWTETSFAVLGDKTHEIKWRILTGRSGSAAGDGATLDCVAWTPTVPPTLAEALNTDLVWTTEGNVLWRGVARESLTDSRDAWAVVSGLGDNGTSAVQTRVYGSGILFFDWAISCEEDYDWMELTVDGEVRDYVTGCADWTSSAVEIVGDGWHVVRWEYVKDEVDDLELAGGNIAMLDNVIWNSDETAPEDSDLIPAISLDTLTSAVDAKVDSIGFADAAVKMAIGGHADEYMLFKAWADVVRDACGEIAGELAVVDNKYAAAAFLLGAERLFENEPTVEIGELAIVDGESAGTTAMTIAVTVKDGESVVKCVAEKVASMFEATGDLVDWTGTAKLTPTVTTSGTDASGKMTFVVTPGDGTAAKAFLRIRR